MNHWSLRQKVKWHLISLMKVTKQHFLYLNSCTSPYKGAWNSAPLVATSSLFITWEVNMVETIAVTWMQIIILLTHKHPHTHMCKHTARQKPTIRVLSYQCIRQADCEKKRVRKITNVSTWFGVLELSVFKCENQGSVKVKYVKNGVQLHKDCFVITT